MSNQQQTTREASHPKPSSSAASSTEGASSASAASSDSSGQRPQNYREVFDARAAHTKFTDPCDVARKESMKCLDKNNYNREACSDFFRNYRECKKTWLDQRREDRRNGLDASG